MLKCPCGKEYRHVQSYRRHARRCAMGTLSDVQEAPDLPKGGSLGGPADQGVQDGEKQELRDIIRTLVDQNRTILRENQKMQSVVREMLPKIGNNNTTFNLSVFLNETCKDAINLSEFVESLKLEAGDLDKTRELGYASGVASILVRGLQQLDIHRRPIHCSDVEREVLFVRDKDAWEEGAHGRGHLKAAISTLAQRQTGKIKEWEAENPDWNKTEEGTQRYIEMVRSVTDKGEGEREESKIISSIAREVDLGSDSGRTMLLIPPPSSLP
tara:strand:- start:2362 stop:3171 length:810 start_codon:yes stop_codon:yes gene_type:complete